MCHINFHFQVGKGLYTPGRPAYAEIVTKSMYFGDPLKFCWIVPDTCPLGMTLAFWMQFKNADTAAPAIVTSANYPPSETNHPTTNSFGIYYFLTSPKKVFVYLSGNTTKVNINYYQTEVTTTLDPNSWYHITMSFSHDNGLKLCVNGDKVC